MLTLMLTLLWCSLWMLTLVLTLRRGEGRGGGSMLAGTAHDRTPPAQVLTLMTANKEGSLRYGHQAGFNNRPMEARFA